MLRKKIMSDNTVKIIGEGKTIEEFKPWAALLNQAPFMDQQIEKVEIININEADDRVIDYLGKNLFSHCGDMTDVLIPASIKMIDENAFGDCINLENIYYTGTEEEWNEIAIMERNDPLFKDKNEKLNIIFNYEAEESESTVPGDANGDGVVGLSDALAILQYLANQMKYPLTEQQKINADVFLHGDSITGMDALTIQKYDAGLYDTLPVSYLGDE